jgi:hypothetical protein
MRDGKKIYSYTIYVELDDVTESNSVPVFAWFPGQKKVETINDQYEKLLAALKRLKKEQLTPKDIKLNKTSCPIISFEFLHAATAPDTPTSRRVLITGLGHADGFVSWLQGLGFKRVRVYQNEAGSI